MRLKYDKDADALEITLSETIVCRTEQFDEGTLVDLDDGGAIVAIEVLCPARRWPLDDIVERYGMGENDEAVLRSLWAAGERFPFEEQLALA